MTATATAEPRPAPNQFGLPDPGERVPRLAVPTVALWVGTLALFAVEMVGYLVLGVPAWLTIPVGAAVTFLMFTVLHESTHHAISTNTGVNNLFGFLSMPFVIIFGWFPMVRFLHIEHHRNTNEPHTVDPDAWTSEGRWWQMPFRWATIDLAYAVFWNKRMRERPTGEVVAVLGSIAVTIAAATALVVAGYGFELLILLVIPQRIGLIVLAWWFDYLPHHGLKFTGRQDRFRATRVRVGGELWLTPVLLYQNYHLVHHLHPSVPFYRYIRAWRRNEDAYLANNASISTAFGRSVTPAEYRAQRGITPSPVIDAGGNRRPTFHPLRVGHLRHLTADSVLVEFEMPEELRPGFQYAPGQHVTLRTQLRGDEIRRSYSICASASEQTIRVVVKRTNGGRFSTFACDELRVGDILDVMTPNGRFGAGLESARGAHTVAVAAGSGITPIYSIVTSLLEADERNTVTLVYGSPTSEATIFGSELDALSRHHGDRLVVHHVLSRAGSRPQRISDSLVMDLLGDTDDVGAWLLCGPQAMVEEIRTAAGRTGVDPTAIHTEIFHSDKPSADSAVDAVTSDVTVLLDAETTSFTIDSSATTVLDAALDNGIAAPYSCAGGACGTCRAKVLFGSASMEQNHALTPDEVEQGYVLTCQAHPTTERISIDYDC